MALTKVYLLALSALILVCFCAGANMRLKRSESGSDTNLDANGRCIVARNWKEDCNDCWCVANGVPACTLKGCVQIPVEVTPAPGTEQMSPNGDGKCKPGSKWTDECNNACWCTDEGVSVCTKIGCERVEEK